MFSVPPAARAGVRASLPLLVGLVPFGLVAGVAAVDAGLSPVAAVGMSVVVFAGASQLAVIDLLGSDASLAVVVLTGVVINLRILMYSASIAPYFQRYRPRRKGLLAYFLTDQAYAVAVAWYESDDADGEGADAADADGEGAADADDVEGGASGGSSGPDDGDRTDGGTAEGARPVGPAEPAPLDDGEGEGEGESDDPGRDWYFLGAGASIWVVWVVTTAVGVGLGRGLPDAWGLDFAVPLVFLALVVPRIEDAPTAAAGGVAGLVALLGVGLPFELGLPVAAAVGVAVGLVAEEVRGR
jgi:predicted branched-subunit amino acid permease